MTSRSKPKRYIECPFCSGVLEPKIGKMKCNACHAKFDYDDRMESVFLHTEDLKLLINGTVCSMCGLVQGWRFRDVCTVEMICPAQSNNRRIV